MSAEFRWFREGKSSSITCSCEIGLVKDMRLTRQVIPLVSRTQSTPLIGGIVNKALTCECRECPYVVRWIIPTDTPRRLALEVAVRVS